MPQKKAPISKPGRRGKKPGRNVDTSDETKRKCLRAASEIFFKRRTTVDPFRSVTLAEVAKKAGVSRSGLAYHWSARKAFIEDLASFLLGEGDLFKEEFDRIKRELRSTNGLPPLQAISRTARVDLETLENNLAWRSMEVLSLMYTHGNERLSALARSGYESNDRVTWNEIYGVLMSRMGRQPRPPFDGPAIGKLLQALVEGSGIREIFDPFTFLDSRRLGANAEHGAYPLAVASILAVLTMPTHGSDTRDVSKVLTDLLRGQRRVKL